MRKLYPFGWIDRDLKDLGFLKEMSASATKLYILYVLAGGADGKSDYSTRALIEATGLSNATIYKARQELEDMGLITTRKEMVPGRRNKKPKVWAELQDLPISRIEVKQRRDKAREGLIIKRIRKRRATSVIARSEATKQSHPKYTMPPWMQEAAALLRRKREAHD
ncbi:MAG: hypothetical protein HQ593_00150 [Candidatus Omnitrophica bacterium]|nr:hypothetical protein [Candidatus Omnitrophota bacterium]